MKIWIWVSEVVLYRTTREQKKHDKSSLVNFLISNLLVLQTIGSFKIVALALSSTSDGTWLELDGGYNVRWIFAINNFNCTTILI